MEQEMRPKQASCEEMLKMAKSIKSAFSLYKLGLTLEVISNDQTERLMTGILTNIINVLGMKSPPAAATQSFVATNLKKMGRSNEEINEIMSKARRKYGQT